MTLVKICGITNVEDMETALAAGADYVGIVRESASPRYVENPLRMVEMAGGRAACVAVYGPFYDDAYVQLFDSIQTITSLDRPNLLQTFRIGETPVEKIVQEARGPILLDAFHEGAYGGTGTTVDWDLAREVVAACRHPVFLAGGLTPENVAEAIRRVRPYAVDVSSGVEAAPGKKDASKVKSFIEAVRNV